MNQVDILTRQFHEAVKYIQDNCQHASAIKTPGSDTGNWCKADDRYWNDYKCPECNKQWRVYSK